MNLPSVTINGTALSDLFFNAEHPNLDLAHPAGEPPTNEEYRDALFKDALDFASLLDDQVTAEQLVADFMARR